MSDVTWNNAQGDEMNHQSFLGMLEAEGGSADLLSYGGFSYFPPELQEAAQAAERALNLIEERILEIEDLVEDEEDDDS